MKGKGALRRAVPAVLILLLGVSALWLARPRPVRAADCVVTVNGRPLEAGGRPAAIEAEGELLVWVDPVARQLGYEVAREGDALRVEDSIQWALLRSGAAEADFTGKLTVINLTRELPLPGPVREYRGELYASLAVFEGFFNEVTAGPGELDISPVVYELCGG